MAVIRNLGGKLYGVCNDCGKVVRLDKPLFGSAHLCTTQEERQKYPEQISRAVTWAEAALKDAK